MSACIQIFKILQIIISKYSRQPVKDLIDHYLRIKIITHIHLQSMEVFLQSLNMNEGDKVIFTKKQKYKGSRFICIIIDHEKYFNLSKKILAQIDECIVLNTELQQTNNILSLKQENLQENCKAIILKTDKIEFQQFTESLDAYLSICQLFHGHTHLIMNCFQASIPFNLRQEMMPVVGDQFEGFCQQGYFRILQERASRITLDELSDSCNISRFPQGEMFIFETGFDGIIIWVTENFMPKLTVIPAISIPVNKQRIMPLFMKSQIGFKIYKSKKVFKEKIVNLNFTTIIFNLHKYSPGIESNLNQTFNNYCKKFFSTFAVSHELVLLNENIKNGERVCKILEIDSLALIKKLLIS